jgi:hypothetical protein
VVFVGNWEPLVFRLRHGGDLPDRLPWAPRLEFWYRARVRSGTLPAGLRGLSLPEIADRLGMGCYSVVPDFTDCPRETDMLDCALGIYNLPVFPYQATLEPKRRVVRAKKLSAQRSYGVYYQPSGNLKWKSWLNQDPPSS